MISNLIYKKLTTTIVNNCIKKGPLKNVNEELVKKKINCTFANAFNL